MNRLFVSGEIEKTYNYERFHCTTKNITQVIKQFSNYRINNTKYIRVEQYTIYNLPDSFVIYY